MAISSLKVLLINLRKFSSDVLPLLTVDINDFYKLKINKKFYKVTFPSIDVKPNFIQPIW